MKSTFILILGLLFCNNSHAQIQPEDPYVHLQTLGGGANFFLNDTIVLMARVSGSSGTVGYFSELNFNNLTWRHRGILPENISSVKALAMEDNSKGVLMSANNSIFYTANGGETFTQVDVPITSPQTAQNVFKTSRGYLAHYRLNNNNHPLYFSANGIVWQVARDGGGFNTPSFVGDTIYYLDAGQLKISPDGGETFPNITLNLNFPVSFTYFHAVNHTIFYGGNQDASYRSTNGGTTWESTNLPPTTFGIQGAFFKNAIVGVLYQGANQGFFITTDGGESFAPPASPMSLGGGTTFKFTSNRLYVNTNAYTEDFGQSWKSLFPNIGGGFEDISFKNGIGLMVGGDGEFKVTTNGGYHFASPGANFTSNRLTACLVLNDSIMLAGTLTGGEIWRSTNRGANWTRVFNSGQNNRIRRFKVSDEGYIYASRSFTDPLYSKDFGETFSAISVGNFADFKPNGSILNAVESNGIITVSTRDIPELVSSQLATIANGSFEIFDMKMASNNVGYIFGEEDDEKLISYRTTNGGTTWTRQEGVQESVIDFSTLGSKTQTFDDQKIAIAQSLTTTSEITYNKLFLSNNGGADWTVHELQNPGVSDHDFSLKGIHFFDTDKFIFSGNNKVFLNGFKTVDSQLINIKEVVGNKQINSLKVFPNPSQDLVFIDLGNEKANRIILMDLQGRILKNINTPGNLVTLELDVNSGIYIIQAFEGEKLIGTSKMIKQ